MSLPGVIFKSEMHKNAFASKESPAPTGVYSAFSDPLAGSVEGMDWSWTSLGTEPVSKIHYPVLNPGDWYPFLRAESSAFSAS